MWGLGRWFGSREIDAWRDDFTLLAARTFNQLATDILNDLDKSLGLVGLKVGLLGQRRYIAKEVAPAVRATAEPIVIRLVAEANEALGEIVQHRAIWSRSPEPAEDAPTSFEGWQEIGATAAPLAGGVALAASLPAASVATTATWFGLVTITTIKWPVILIGAPVAAIAIATGLLSAAKIREKAEARLRIRVREFVVAALIRGKPHQPAILEQLTTLFADAAEEAKKL